MVDLSVLLVPGHEERRLEIRKGLIPHDRTVMHEIDTMSHIGTHIEAPLHFYEDGKDVTELPLWAYMGNAVLLDVRFDGPGGKIDPPLLEREVGPLLRPGYIVIIRNTGKGFKDGDEKPSLTIEAASWLADRKIKMLGFDPAITIGTTVDEIRTIHDILMKHDITFLEVLANLHELKKREFYLLALPWNVKGLDSSPVRAIALELI
ncbi:MAG TPA: hypothetical protein GX509_07875 [Firmicutes bacterium]|nr:hypothetical protein [Bacillota bacterium]